MTSKSKGELKRCDNENCESFASEIFMRWEGDTLLPFHFATMVVQSSYVVGKWSENI